MSSDQTRAFRGSADYRSSLLSQHPRPDFPSNFSTGPIFKPYTNYTSSLDVPRRADPLRSSGPEYMSPYERKQRELQGSANNILRSSLSPTRRPDFLTGAPNGLRQSAVSPGRSEARRAVEDYKMRKSADQPPISIPIAASRDIRSTTSPFAGQPLSTLPSESSHLYTNLLSRDRLERERLERERDRLERERLDRLERERERDRLERERERDRLERDRLERERDRFEREKLERLARDRERYDREREKERERERSAQMEIEREQLRREQEYLRTAPATFTQTRAPPRPATPSEAPPEKKCVNYSVLGCSQPPISENGMCASCTEAYDQQCIADEVKRESSLGMKNNPTYGCDSREGNESLDVRAQNLKALPANYSPCPSEVMIRKYLESIDAQPLFSVMDKDTITRKRTFLGSESLSRGDSSYSLSRFPSDSSREDAILAGKGLLQKRLARLNLREEIMDDDGNCQYRAFSHQLYGTQDYHKQIRRLAVQQLTDFRDLYIHFFEDSQQYENFIEITAMESSWGDEITLKAVCDYFRVIIHVMLSTEGKYHLKYEPTPSRTVKRESRHIFISYIAPIHYNSIVLNSPEPTGMDLPPRNLQESTQRSASSAGRR